MIILIILAVIFSVSVYYLKTRFGKNEIISAIAFLSSCISASAIFVLICVTVSVKTDYFRDRKYNELNEKYKAIMQIYDSDKDNIVSLTSEISEYNAEVINGRMAMDSLWFSLYNYDFYYDLSLIELG
jgi:hypothetical protein